MFSVWEWLAQPEIPGFKGLDGRRSLRKFLHGPAKPSTSLMIPSGDHLPDRCSCRMQRRLVSRCSGEATATDNCDDPIDITILYADGVVGGVCTGESVITRTWTATDVCGNSSSCVQTITTEDTTVPDLTCPSNTVAECSDDLTPAGQDCLW